MVRTAKAPSAECWASCHSAGVVVGVMSDQRKPPMPTKFTAPSRGDWGGPSRNRRRRGQHQQRADEQGRGHAPQASVRPFDPVGGDQAY